MRTKQILSVLVLAALLLGLLTACSTPGGEETQAPPSPVEYRHSIGVSLSMAEGFTESSVEGILAGYEGSEVNIRFAEELFETLEGLGYSREMTLEEYAQLILDAYGLSGEPLTDSYGNVCITYTQEIQGREVAYYAYFDKGAAAFWTTTFMCFAELAPSLEADFGLWASTIRVPDTAVTEPIVQTPQPEALTQEESEDLIETVEKLAPVDFLGKSFTAAELTDTELLQVAYGIYGGRSSGFASMGSTWFTDKVAARYFGRTEVALADIPCSCGVTLAVYSAAEDIFDWDGSNAHDHTAHTCRVVNLYQDAYRLEDTYCITMYKLFPDLNENAGSGSVSFYATYADAQARSNPLFTAANEAELNAQLEALDASQLVLYTHRYVLGEEGYFTLVDYTIG